MKTQLGLALALLALGASSGCGVGATGGRAVGADSSVASVKPADLRDDGDVDGAAAAAGVHNGTGADSDDDSDNGSYYDWDDQNVLDYGHPATAADARATTTVVRSYYAMAARGDGDGSCRLLSASMARSVPREYRGELGLPASRGRACAPVMSALLRRLHQQWSADDAALKVGVVRVDGATADVLLGFGDGWPNRYMALKREHGAWRVASLLEEALP